jgi:peroxiredoxin
MSTETFVRCLKRFSARRGIPRKLLSDNGKTAAQFVDAVLKENIVQDHLSGRGIE